MFHSFEKMGRGCLKNQVDLDILSESSWSCLHECFLKHSLSLAYFYFGLFICNRAAFFNEINVHTTVIEFISDDIIKVLF